MGFGLGLVCGAGCGGGGVFVYTNKQSVRDETIGESVGKARYARP
jgi:mevalonate kinase